MRKRKLGALEVSELGFGVLSFASTYGQAPDKAESIRVIRGAHDLGVTLFGWSLQLPSASDEAVRPQVQNCVRLPPGQTHRSRLEGHSC